MKTSNLLRYSLQAAPSASNDHALAASPGARPSPPDSGSVAFLSIKPVKFRDQQNNRLNIDPEIPMSSQSYFDQGTALCGVLASNRTALPEIEM
jgi:hypothetical protein